MNQTIETADGVSIPDQYNGLVTDIGHPAPRQLKQFYHGPIDSGKTTFCCSWPRTAVIETEDKAGFVRELGEGSKVFTFPSDDKKQAHQKFDEFINWLFVVGMKGESPFDTIAFDTVHGVREFRLATLTERYKKYGLLKGALDDITDYRSEGAGWGKLNRDVLNVFERVQFAGYGWIAMAHIFPRLQTSKDGVTERWDDSNLNDGIIQGLAKMADFSGHFAKTKKPNRQTKRVESAYFLRFTEKNPRIPTRCPCPMSTELDLTDRSGCEVFTATYEGACNGK